MSTAVTVPKVEDLTLSITEEIHVRATPEATFDALLEQLGPGMTGAENKPMLMKIEASPGGRWYRELGDGNGHLWAHVQAIKRPTLLEFYGPLMMSYPALNHLQYRLREEGGVTRLAFLHRALGWILPEHRDSLSKGWEHWLGRIRELAQRKNRKGT